MPITHSTPVPLYYESVGAGEPLLLIAGFACDHSIWSLVQPSLVAKHRVISFDNQGVGQSATPEGPWTISEMAENTVLMLDEVGVGPVHVAGHSMGGMIAQELALRHPDRVRSLLLLSSAARCGARGTATIEVFGELPRLVDPSTSARLIMPWIYADGFYLRPGAVEQLMKWLLECPFPPTPEGMYHQSRAIAGFDASRRLSAIQCPTLILVGKEDIMLPCKYSEELARGIPAAELVVLENAGHGLPVEVPQATAAAMLKFLGGCG